jgi:LmbE family N-acetylglucosaminyl deacetylase
MQSLGQLKVLSIPRQNVEKTMADEVNIREIWGVLSPRVLERIVVVSPHFDDAALGTAHLLATYPGSTVITVLGGQPPAYPDHVTPWDEAGGFVTGDDVVSARREEDRRAMAFTNATPVWLEFPDHQYLAVEERPTPAEVAPSLKKAIVDANPTAVFLPMGIANPDHVLAHEAGLLARGDLSESGAEIVWFCYEDHGYKHLPGILAWRISQLFGAGIWPTPSIVPIEVDMDQKRALIAIYKTQVAPLEQDHMLAERLDANVPEQFWRLSAPIPVIAASLMGDA